MSIIESTDSIINFKKSNDGKGKALNRQEISNQ
jgi:hypothetical protein